VIERAKNCFFNVSAIYLSFFEILRKKAKKMKKRFKKFPNEKLS